VAYLYSIPDPASVSHKERPKKFDPMGMIVTQIVIIVLLLLILGLFAFDDWRNRKIREIEDRLDQCLTEKEDCEAERE